MNFSLLPFLIIVVTVSAFWSGQFRAKQLGTQTKVLSKSAGNNLHSLPSYHGFYLAFSVAIPALIIWLTWQCVESSFLTWYVKENLHINGVNGSGEFSLLLNDIRNFIGGGISSATHQDLVAKGVEVYLNAQRQGRFVVSMAVVVSLFITFTLAYRSIRVELRTRNIVEKVITCFLFFSSGVAILTTVGILASVLFESIRFFQEVPITDFLFGTKWSPQTAMRADQAGSSGAFGIWPIFTGTMLIATIAMMVAIPLGLMAAIYLSEYASAKVRTYVKPMLEILAGIPTVVYGFFAALTVAPFIRDLGESFGVAVASESALAAGLVMGIMIIPFVSSLSDDVIHAVPQSLRDGSYALGATQYETTRNVILPAALPGVVGSILLAVSRAVGETMIVVMAAGLSANFSVNPLTAVTTITVQIVTLLTGDQEFDSAKTLAAFALGLFLFVFTLLLNIVALHVVRRYREQYD